MAATVTVHATPTPATAAVASTECKFEARERGPGYQRPVDVPLDAQVRGEGYNEPVEARGLRAEEWGYNEPMKARGRGGMCCLPYSFVKIVTQVPVADILSHRLQVRHDLIYLERKEISR
jgi:hypothetical protein